MRLRTLKHPWLIQRERRSPCSIKHSTFTLRIGSHSFATPAKWRAKKTKWNHWREKLNSSTQLQRSPCSWGSSRRAWSSNAQKYRSIQLVVRMIIRITSFPSYRNNRKVKRSHDYGLQSEKPTSDIKTKYAKINILKIIYPWIFQAFDGPSVCWRAQVLDSDANFL